MQDVWVAFKGDLDDPILGVFDSYEDAKTCARREAGKFYLDGHETSIEEGIYGKDFVVSVTVKQSNIVRYAPSFYVQRWRVE